MAKRTALITGASRGIGKACAETLSLAGYRVILAARSADTLRDVSPQPARFHDIGLIDLADAAVALARKLERDAADALDLGFGVDLGIDAAAAPVRQSFDAARLASLLRGSRAPLKSALLDQKRIAGLGNIYACEALWRARLSPFRPAGGLARADGRPAPAAKALAAGIRAGVGMAPVLPGLFWGAPLVARLPSARGSPLSG